MPALLRRLLPLVALLLALGLPATPAVAAQSFSGRLFSPTSPWNTPLPAQAPLDRSSSRRVAPLVRSVIAGIHRGWYPAVASTTYSTPIYVARRSQRRVPVVLDNPAHGLPLRGPLLDGVPIPADAKPAAGTDRHLTVYQPSTDTLWELWHARREADGWHAGWGGAMRHVRRNPGYYSDAAWHGLSRAQGWDWGSTASSLPAAAGTVTLAELRAGKIRHALAASIDHPCQSLFAWPAQRTDGDSTSPDCLPEGSRLRLDPRVDVDALDLPPVTRMLAKAAQEYGIIIRDRTGATFSFYLEAPQSGSPYFGPHGLYGGQPGWSLLAKFPFRQLQLMPMRTCSSRPCAAPRRSSPAPRRG